MNALMRKSAISIFAALMLASSCAAQSRFTDHTLQLDDPNTKPSGAIGQMAWMAGHWRGEGLGGAIDEMWSPPMGSRMMGAFQLVQADTVAFYELMAFVEEENSLALWVKHFNPDFSGWEEKHDKVVFPLVRIEPAVAYFHGLTFERVDDDSLRVFLAFTRDGSPVSETMLTYRRLP